MDKLRERLGRSGWVWWLLLVVLGIPLAINLLTARDYYGGLVMGIYLGALGAVLICMSL